MLALFVAAFIIVAIDLGSEMAAEKDEIGVVLAIFEESFSNIILSADLLADFDRPLLFEISPDNSYPLESICKNSIYDRGPPVII